jgi:hypothetical protein
MKHELREFLIILASSAFLGLMLSLLEEHVTLAWIGGGLYMAGIYTHRLRMLWLGHDNDAEMSRVDQEICALCKAERAMMERRMELEKGRQRRRERREATVSTVVVIPLEGICNHFH